MNEIPLDIAETLVAALLFWQEESKQRGKVYLQAEEEFPEISARVKVAFEWIEAQVKVTP
jgi:hypothetical protein